MARLPKTHSLAWMKKEESDDSENDMSIYAPPEEVPADSDTLPIGGEDNSSFCSGTKRPMDKIYNVDNPSSSGVKHSTEKRDNGGSSSKKAVKESRIGKSADEINSTLQALLTSLASPPPVVPPSPPCDPHGKLWERLESMTITTDQKLTVGTFLATKENKDLRGILCSSSDNVLDLGIQILE